MPDPNDRFLGLCGSGGLPAPARGGGPNPAGDLLVVMDRAEHGATECGVKWTPSLRQTGEIGDAHAGDSIPAPLAIPRAT